MNKYKNYNLGLGWLSFVIAAVVYILTTEPTASLWDCSEFIATSYKLEVGHPPGAPLFMMIARFFTIFSPDVTKVALAVNIMSCLASALTIAFLFWTITHLARKMFSKPEGELSTGEIWAVMGAGLIGSLGYAFTDTFWFSGVEGEVYALSSLFTAVVFWAMLKWENVADQPHANRWLILIAYLMGLSIGVHLLNLLAFPAIVFIYYFKKYPKTTKKGVFYATVVSAAVVAFVLYFIVPYTVSIGAFFDRIFVNSFGLPINSGILFYAVALFVLLGLSVYITHKKGKVLLNTIMLMVTVVVLGYSSYTSVIIRSAVNPPMNSNKPDNPYGLMTLLSREQYGDRPLVKGHYYSSPPVDYKTKSSYYVGDDGKYKKFEQITGIEYDPEFTTIFPRMHSPKAEHIEAYKSWGEIVGRKVRRGEETIIIPTFGENLRFFFSYQLNFMYWRYFLWNFVGRQSDVQSTGSIANGQWLSGIKPIDALYLGPQDNLPSELANNKGRNTYFFLPFILGIIGLIFQLNRDKKDFSVVMWLFFMTGIAIVIYLNQSPGEPRERDYAYAGSFYAFSIWIGLGVLSIYEAFRKFAKKRRVAAVAATALCTCVPLILISQNWDDHDRSGRYVARDFGYNYLTAVLPNSIIMNFGDNDTFPLWYNQEVEEVRHDVRIMNLSYLGAEWYIDEMKVKANDSDPVPFSLPRSKYTGVNGLLPVEPLFNTPQNVRDVIEFIKSDSPRSKVRYGRDMNDFVPTRLISIPVNKQNAIASGIVKPEDAHLMVDTIVLNIKGSSIDRVDMMLLDLLANFEWKRPLFFTSASQFSALADLKSYMQFDGFSYRLVPIYTPYETFLSTGRIDTDYLWDNLMNKFRYGNISDPRTYADYTIRNTYTSNQVLNGFARLAKGLAAKGEYEKAHQALDRGMKVAPYSQLGYSYTSTKQVIEALYAVGDTTKANSILTDYSSILMENIDYYWRFPISKKEMVYNDLGDNVNMLIVLNDLANNHGQTAIAERFSEYFRRKGLE